MADSPTDVGSRLSALEVGYRRLREDVEDIGRKIDRVIEGQKPNYGTIIAGVALIVTLAGGIVGSNYIIIDRMHEHTVTIGHPGMVQIVSALTKLVDQHHIEEQREMRDLDAAIQHQVDANRSALDYLRNNYDQRATKHDLDRLEDRLVDRFGE